MKGTRIVTLLSVSLLLLGFVACGGGGGGGGGSISYDSPTFVSTNTENTEFLETDGDWMVWTGHDKSKVLWTNGTDVKEFSRGLTGLLPKELAFDGVYLAVRAIDNTMSYLDTVNGGHVELYFYDTTKDDPGLVQITDTPFYGDYDMAASNGILLWWDYSDSVWAYDMAHRVGPVAISGNVTVGLEPHPNISGNTAVWSYNNTVYAANVSDLAAFSYTDDAVVLGPGANPRVDGSVVVWENNNAIYCDDLADGYGTVVQLSSGPAYWPGISGDLVVWRQHDGNDYEIIYADVSDLASYHTDNIKWLTDDAVNDYYPQIAGTFVAWLGGSDPEIYAADLSGGLTTAQGTIVQVSTGYGGTGNYQYHEFSEEWYRQTFLVDALGNVVWTEYDEEDDTNNWYELAFSYNILTEVTRDMDGLGEYQRFKQAELVNGSAAVLAYGAFERIWARKAGSRGAPIALSAKDQKSHQPEVDGGIVVWSGMPAVLDDESQFEIFYADLNADSPVAVQVTDNDNRDKKPDVDGENGIIVFKDYDNSEYYYYLIGDDVNDVNLIGYGNDAIHVAGGIATWRDNSNNIYYHVIGDPLDSVEQINSGSVTAYNCPVIDNGIIAWPGSDYELHYCDVLSASPADVKATSEYYVSNGSSGAPNISEGIIAFGGQSMAGTDGVFIYRVGDPMDQVTTVSLSGVVLDGVCRPRIGGDIVAFIADVDGGNEYNHELFTYRISTGVLTQETDDTVVDSKPSVGKGLVIWRHGGYQCGGGSAMVYALKP